jgi:predicted ArsR family transcriptional regulator
MAQEEILTELRTIRTLLALDKEERLRELTPELSDTQHSILDELDYSEWNTLPTSDIADDHDIHANTVRDHRDELVENSMIFQSGSGSGTEYRKTGLFRSAEELGLIDTE